MLVDIESNFVAAGSRFDVITRRCRGISQVTLDQCPASAFRPIQPTYLVGDSGWDSLTRIFFLFKEDLCLPPNPPCPKNSNRAYHEAGHGGPGAAASHTSAELLNNRCFCVIRLAWV